MRSTENTILIQSKNERKFFKKDEDCRKIRKKSANDASKTDKENYQIAVISKTQNFDMLCTAMRTDPPLAALTHRAGRTRAEPLDRRPSTMKLHHEVRGCSLAANIAARELQLPLALEMDNGKRLSEGAEQQKWRQGVAEAGITLAD